MTRRQYLENLAGKTFFMQGDVAVAYGALYAGCCFFAGYPITPASEVAETMARELPNVGGYYVQMEDELASMSAVIGAVWAGGKAMTATSGPGYSLMQENIGYAFMTETPCVIVNVQRSGPSTGQATKPAQGDVMQARWGTHGDHESIAICPSSVQECLDFTIEAFNLSERYRTPVTLLMDGEIGHMREKLTMPTPDEIEIEQRIVALHSENAFGGKDVPGMIPFGTDRAVHVTGSTHRPDGMRDVSSQEVHEELVTRLCGKITAKRAQIVKLEEYMLDDAEYAVVSYGATARPAKGAVLRARESGIRVGLVRMITIWPFAQENFANLGKRVTRILVPEMNLGQISREIERFVQCEVVSISKVGGVVHTVHEIYSRILSTQ